MEEIKEFRDELVGMTISEACTFLNDKGFIIRPTIKDFQPLVVTRDYNLKRINVSVDINNKILNVLNLG